MDIKINITPEQVEATIGKAVVDSSIGKMISGAVNKALGDYTLQRAVDDVVARVMRETIVDQLRADPDFAPRVKALVSAKISDDFIKNILDKILDKIDWGS